MFSTMTSRTASTCLCTEATFEADSGCCATKSAARARRGPKARSRACAGAEASEAGEKALSVLEWKSAATRSRNAKGSALPALSGETAQKVSPAGPGSARKLKRCLSQV